MDSVNEVSELLGNMLLDENYSIESLIKRAQEKNMTLSELRDQLLKHQQDLNQTSLELFNNSYDRFYKLSHIIACLAEPIQHVINPLQNYRNRLAELCHNHDVYIDNINQKLDSLEETNRNKQLASKMITLIKRQSRIFHQIQHVEWLKRPSVDSIIKEPFDNIDHKVNCDTIERICTELHYLVCEIIALQPTKDELISIKKSLESSVREQQSHLGAWFYDLFREAIQAQNKPVIKFILRTFKQMEHFKLLDNVWRNSIVRPYLDLTIASDSSLLPQMKQTYELLEQFLQKHADLIEANFVIRSFWHEVTEALDKLDKIYTSDDINTFKERYLLTNEFMNVQNNFINDNSDSTSLKAIEAKANTKKIMSRFDLSGYFNQRSTEIRASLEAGLSQHPLSEVSGFVDPTQIQADNTDQNHQYKLRICMHIHNLIIRCWSPEIYIDVLDDSLSQLVCLILERYADWLNKLRLSDFRIVGTTTSDGNRTTDFLSKQDAIMRILIEDCARLEDSIKKFESGLPQTTESRRKSIVSSFEIVNNGLNNVRNLQQLLER